MASKLVSIESLCSVLPLVQLPREKGKTFPPSTLIGLIMYGHLAQYLGWSLDSSQR